MAVNRKGGKERGSLYMQYSWVRAECPIRKRIRTASNRHCPIKGGELYQVDYTQDHKRDRTGVLKPVSQLLYHYSTERSGFQYADIVIQAKDRVCRRTASRNKFENWRMCEILEGVGEYIWQKLFYNQFTHDMTEKWDLLVYESSPIPFSGKE